jgi:bacterioferritin
MQLPTFQRLRVAKVDHAKTLRLSLSPKRPARMQLGLSATAIRMGIAYRGRIQRMTPPSRTAPTVTPKAKKDSPANAREQLIANLNEDLAREYQAIIAYVVYSQAIKGASYMRIASELEVHAAEELKHALIIAKQIDYLGGDIGAVPKPVKTSDDAKQMLRFDLENEATTIRAYRDRVREAEALGEFAIAEHIREILMEEQDHLIELATALGEDPPNVSG